MTRLFQKLIFLLTIFGLMGGTLQAQNSEELLEGLLQEDKASIEALVLYPEDTRNDILQASLYPEMIVRIGEMQKVTSQQFVDLLAPFSQEDQERFWDLARYPDLVSEIANSKSLGDAQLKVYPETVQENAKWASRKHANVMVKMDGLYGASEKAFESLLQGYDARTQSAYRNLVALPEVMSILSESLKMTVLVGDLYRRNPEWVDHKLDSLNLEVARKNAEDLEAWRDSLEANPEALKQFEASAEEFRQAQGQEVVNTTQIVEYTTVVNYRYVPYPWWYGYPTWYSYSYWYPTPYWYDCGYYYGPGNVIVVNYLPSPYFTYWYFQNPWHHHHYPHLTNHFLNYHQGHRDSPSGFNREVSNWTYQHRDEFGRDWLRNDAERVDRIKEYGQFEVDYHAAATAHPNTVTTPKAYFESNANNYPLLSQTANNAPSPKPSQPTMSKPNTNWPSNAAPRDNEPKPRPSNTVEPKPRPSNTVTPKSVEPKPRPSNTVTPKSVEPKPSVRPLPKSQPRIEPAIPSSPKIERPKQYIAPSKTQAPAYHNDSWQRVQPRSSYPSTPTISPRPTVSPRQSTPRKSGGRK